MTDSRRSEYLYSQHPLAIHSTFVRPAESPLSLAHTPAPHLLANHEPPHPRPHLASPAAASTPLLILQPLLHLSRSHHPYHSTLPASFPAVIVSAPTKPTVHDRDPPRPVAKKPSAKPADKRAELDGSAGVDQVVPTSAPMTSNGRTNMPSKRSDAPAKPHAQRPSIVSQHSNSVPSTPLQVARQYESRSRSPSPNGGLGSHSPRSVSSEANGAMPTLRTPRAYRCKYETNAAFGRRRIPYTSSDVLEKPKEEPKKTLDPHEDDKLSGDMRELYDRLVPTEENANRRTMFVEKLHTILDKEFPGNEFKVHVFGSSGNMLYTSESDVDICIQTPMKRLEEMHTLADALAKNGMEKVVCVPQAKVRIVKVWDPVLELACDMNVNNTLALENTRMIKTYIQIDDRIRRLAMIIKYWTKQRILNDAALGGTISSYTWICMILNFLQTRNPPILPALHSLPDRAVDETTGKRSDSEFADDLEKLRGFGEKNTETLGQLLFHFFRQYGHEVDYEKDVISVRQGRLLTREEKNWHLAGLQKEARNRLCVEEPFNTERNLGNSADDFAWRGIHLEIRRAFDLLADGQQLEKACEQYEFPPEEKPSAAFKKPQATKTTLTSSSSARGGRNGGHRGGRGGFNQKGNGNYGRRASSSSFGGNRPPFLNSPPIAPMSAQEYFSPRGLNEQLHDQLFQQYQMLEMQSNSLRAQLAAQQRAHHVQQAQAAQMHAHAVAQAQAQHSRGASSANGSPQKSPYINGRSSPRLAEAAVPTNGLPHGFLYHYPGFFDPSQVSTSVAQDGSRTNPSSPSLPHSVPGLRRQSHRASNASETSNRSQSQPARGVPPHAVIAGYPPMPPIHDPTTFAGYPIARSTQEVPHPHSAVDTHFAPLPHNPEPVPSSEHGVPREYVGYYVEEQNARPLQEYTVPQIPSFTELSQRRRRVSSEITQPLLNTALRRVSRSPSPLGGHMRSFSTGVAQPGANAEQRKDRVDSARTPRDNGPVIVNGSFPTQARARSETVDAPPLADPMVTPTLGVYTNINQYGMPNQDHGQQYMLDEVQRQRPGDVPMSSNTNGPLVEASPIDRNAMAGLPSGNRQQFPGLADAWVNYDLTNGNMDNHSEEISPTRVQPAQWRAVQYPNGMPSLDTINVTRAPPQEIKSATLPLLSPVFETRTPSPTSSRQPDSSKHINGMRSQTKELPPQARRASQPVNSATPKDHRGNQQKGNASGQDKNNKTSTGNGSSNAWQQQPRKKKNRKGPAGNKANENKSTGEPLPANAADRKGG